jgi:membrane associated rhomboid family serine protease
MHIVWRMSRRSIISRRFRDNTYRNYTLRLIIINLLVFFVTDLVSSRAVLYLAMIPSLVLRGWVWQFVTYMFVHGNLTHLLFNMLSLFIFGSMVEKRIGSKEFLLFYLLTGFFSGIASFVSYYLSGTNAILVGASGAIYGVLLMFAVFFPYSVIFVFGILPVRAPILVIIYAGIELYSQVFGRGGNIAHLTHLSGLIFAYLYCRIRMKINPIDVFKRTL